MVATNTASDLELCASTYRHFSPAGFSSEIFIVENNSRVIQKTNNKRIEKIKREDILRENFQIYGIALAMLCGFIFVATNEVSSHPGT